MSIDIYDYPTRLIAHLLYGCGLRVSEPLDLRLKDVDLQQRRLYIHQSKGKKGHRYGVGDQHHPWQGVRLDIVQPALERRRWPGAASEKHRARHQHHAWQTHVPEQ